MAFGAYKILRSTKTVDVIPAFDELIYFLIIFVESRVEVNICWLPKCIKKRGIASNVITYDGWRCWHKSNKMLLHMTAKDVNIYGMYWVVNCN